MCDRAGGWCDTDNIVTSSILDSGSLCSLKGQQCQHALQLDITNWHVKVELQQINLLSQLEMLTGPK